jgi:hypothetical protein
MMAEPRRHVSLLTLSLGLYPGAILWGFQLWVSYGLVNVSCSQGFDVMFHLVSLFFAALTAGCVWLSYRWFRDLREGVLVSSGVPGRAEFMALCGIVANVFFLSLIVLGGVPSFFLAPCQS